MVNQRLRAFFNGLLTVSVLTAGSVSAGFGSEDPQVKAEQLIKQGKYREAWEYEKNIMCTDASNPCAHRGLSAVYLGLDETASAINEARAAASAGPTDYRNVYNLAHVLKKANMQAEAVPVYQKAAAMEPKKIEPLIGIDQCLLEMGQGKQSLDLAEVISKKFPADSTAWSNLANVYLRAGKFDKALDTANHSLGLNPQSAAAYQVIALSRMAQRDTCGAKEAATKWMELDPKDPGAYNFVGACCYKDSNDPAAARRLIDKAMANLPNDKVVFFNLGTGMSARAELAGNKQAGGSPEKQLAWLQLSEQALRKAVANNPQCSETRMTLAQVLTREQKFSEALAEARAVQKNDPDNPAVPSLCRYILVAQNDLAGRMRRWLHQSQ